MRTLFLKNLLKIKFVSRKETRILGVAKYMYLPLCSLSFLFAPMLKAERADYLL